MINEHDIEGLAPGFKEWLESDNKQEESMMYVPDNWVVLKFKDHYRVLAGWSGGYLSGDSWRLNSGIVRVEEKPESYIFYSSSGSAYSCHKEGYGLRSNNAYIYDQLREKHGVTLMDEDTDWHKIDWGIQ
jgi:hypothetical protein